MTLVPFGQMRDFVNESVLRNIAPNIIRFNDWKSVAAIVKPFHWKPAFAERDNDAGPSLDWGGSFFEDAQAFIELLAMFHARPATCLVTIPYCVHRTASYLLGQPHYHGSVGHDPMAHSFARFGKSSPVSSHALDEARKAFEGRTTERYKDCAPMIARLAEALARTGRYQIDDKILDVAIALERMYELDGGEISFKLRQGLRVSSRRKRKLACACFTTLQISTRHDHPSSTSGASTPRPSRKRQRSTRVSRSRAGLSSSFWSTATFGLERNGRRAQDSTHGIPAELPGQPDRAPEPGTADLVTDKPDVPTPPELQHIQALMGEIVRKSSERESTCVYRGESKRYAVVSSGAVPEIPGARQRGVRHKPGSSRKWSRTRDNTRP